LVTNDARLTLGDGGKMKLDTDPFHVGMVEIKHNKILTQFHEVGVNWALFLFLKL
jgi:hypothetical protein